MLHNKLMMTLPLLELNIIFYLLDNILLLYAFRILHVAYLIWVKFDTSYNFRRYDIPVNYFYDQEQDKIYFHGAKSGHKVDALKKNDKVCFTVYGNEHFEPGDWAPYVQSTVVFGRCRLVEDAATTEARVRELGLKYYPGREEVEKEIAKAIKGVQLYEITIEHLTGKQIQEK